ncbi:MAG TPA: PQQ-binding-like beta-propeller repeat protein [Patescibacteria group bacterium]|nr:PQQ-binding-like beta-propeller repeat protein [Patescibacteria group bacterium]
MTGSFAPSQEGGDRRYSGLMSKATSRTLVWLCISWVLSIGLAINPRLFAADPQEDWPRFLGPNGNNISTETGLVEKWPTNGLPVIWEKAIGSGYSAPSVLGDRLVVHHRLNDEEIVECLNAANGSTLWRHAYASHFIDPFGYNNGPRGTPIVTSNRCYIFGAEGRLSCLNLENGKPVWEHETAKEWNVPEPFFGVGSTPLLEAGKLIVMVGGQPNSAVVAFDSETGKVLWENGGKTNWDGAITLGWRGQAPYRWSGREKMASYSSPVAATIHGRRSILCFARQGLMSLNPTTGKVFFSYWFQSQINESVNAMCPIVKDDLILISAAYYKIGAVLLRVAPDGKSVIEVWRSSNQPRPNPAESAPGPPVLEIHWNTPVLYDGYVYAFSGRNEPDASFRCIEFATGKLMWSRPEWWRSHSALQPEVYGRGSTILADGKLWVLGEGGKLGLFAPNHDAPQELCSWQVPKLQYPCWAAPVLSRKKLYLRSEERLICLDVSKR